jgi:glutamyl-tRNA reductase
LHLIALGINHQTAPVALRESVAVSDPALPAALTRLSALPAVQEAVLLSTCNRTEVYALVAPTHADPEEPLIHYLSTLQGERHHSLDGHLYCYRDGAAARHVMEVAAGIDSMILGEYQIMAQVKSAYAAAHSQSATGPVLNTLFQMALSCGKRVRSETEISRGAFSVGAAAVELAVQIFGDSLASRTVLVLGAGKMSELTARHLQAKGSPAVLVANRSFDRAGELARQLGDTARAMRFDDLPEALVTSDIVICSTAAPHPVLTRETAVKAMRARRNRALFLIDIAVPRDVESSVGDLENVYLFNIDDLNRVVEQAQKERTGEVAKARQIIEQYVGDYLAWRRSLEVTPLIVAVREKLDAVRLEEMAKLRARASHLSERDLRSLEASLQSFANKVAHAATVAIKDAAHGDPDLSYERLSAIRAAFGLDEPESPEPHPFAAKSPQEAPQT